MSSNIAHKIGVKFIGTSVIFQMSAPHQAFAVVSACKGCSFVYDLSKNISLAALEEGDEISSLFSLLDTSKNHFRPRHVLALKIIQCHIFLFKIGESISTFFGSWR
jgi:hypothetical protein